MTLNNLDWVTMKVNPIDESITSSKANIRFYIWWQVLIYVLCEECVFSWLYIYWYLGILWSYVLFLFSFLMLGVYLCRWEKFYKILLLIFLDFNKKWLNGTWLSHFYLLYCMCSCFWLVLWYISIYNIDGEKVFTCCEYIYSFSCHIHAYMDISVHGYYIHHTPYVRPPHHSITYHVSTPHSI